MLTKTKQRWDEIEGNIVDEEGNPVVERTLSLKEQRQERLRDLEDELLGSSLEVTAGAMDFVALDPHNPVCPKEWVELYGEEVAMRRYRAAMGGMMSAKEAPVGIKVAQSVGIGIIRARATEKSAPRSLSLTMVSMTAPMKEFKELEVGE